MSLADMQDAKEQVRQAIDIVDLVGEYVALRRQGSSYVGLCPWHDDSRPSMQVNPDRQSFKCWVCDIGGDIFSFIMRVEGLEFREALEMLAERAGVELRPTAGSGPAESQFDRRNLLKITAWAEKQFHQCLLQSPEAEPARAYLSDRGIDLQSVERFHIGFAPQEWDWLLRKAAAASWSPEALERVGLVVRRDSGGYYDRFRGRLMFSIRDARSRPIACGGRVLPEFAGEKDAKYINSPETPLFSKSRELFALDLAREGIRREGQIVVMEGYTDVIMAHQHGVDHAVAVLGTALGEQHVPLIRRFTDSITLVLDGDAAGQRRTMDILDNLLALFVAHEVELRILGLPDGSDPCDVILSQGSEAFRALLKESRDALTHKMDVVMQSLSSTSAPHRTAQAVESILGALARALPRGASASSASLMREQQVLVRIAKQFGVADEALRTRLHALRQSATFGAPRRTAIHDEAVSEDQGTALDAPVLLGWERELIELILAQPESFLQIATEVAFEEFVSSAARQLFAAAASLSQRDELPTYDHLMLAVDDLRLKSLLVACDEANQQKTDSDPAQRLTDAVAGAQRRRRDARHEQKMAALHQKQLDPEKEEEVLAELFHELKQQQDSQQR